MRHRKHRSKLNRTSEHRVALLRNLAAALVAHERIHTTKQKAQAVRPFLESLITLARRDTLQARRMVVSRLQDREAAIKLFEEIAPRVGTRPGGYLRIVKDKPRAGDGAEMAFIEFVDQRAPGEEPEKPRDLKQKLKQRRHEQRKAMAKNR